MIKSDIQKSINLLHIAKLLRTAGDESRLKILCVIFRDKNICVSDIANKVDMSIATVSHHLQVMTKEELLMPMRDGKKIFYSFKDRGFARDLKRIICKFN